MPTVGVPVGGELPDSLYPGWEEAWVGSGAPQTVAPAQDWLLLVARGEGTLVFEEHRLGLAVGTFASLPAGLEFQLDGGADLLALQIQVPHPHSIP